MNLLETINTVNRKPAKFTKFGAAGSRRVTIICTAYYAGGFTLDTYQLGLIKQATERLFSSNGWDVIAVDIAPVNTAYYTVAILVNVNSSFTASQIDDNFRRTMQTYGTWNNVNNVNVNDPQQYGNPTPTPAPVGGGGNYTVISGDSMSKIAARFGMTLAQLAALNPQVTNLNQISVGQQLRVSGTPVPVQVITSTPKVLTGGGGNNTTPPVIPLKDEKSWFDKTFFDGAGKITGVGIGVIVVLGAVIVSSRQQ